MNEFYNPVRGPSVKDKEHRYNFYSENDSGKAVSILSLYLMMGCVPKKSNMCSVKAFTAGCERLCGSPAVTIATLLRERLMI